MNQDDPIQLYLTGKLSPEVTLSRLLAAGATVEAIESRIQRMAGNLPGDRLARVFTANKAALGRLRTMIGAVDHATEASPQAIGALFDQAVALCPEGSVALYSLGQPATLAAVTTEIVTWMQEHGLFAPAMNVLDLGCGIGRIAAALAPLVRSVVGIDVSAAMVREARRRHAEVANVSFAVTSGCDLMALCDGAFDMVLAVDSFPYLVQAAMAERHVAECRRVLRAGGRVIVLNVSYRHNWDLDRADVALWARQNGLSVSLAEEHAFRIWDGSAIVMSAPVD